MANSGQSRKVLITQLAAIRPEQLATLPPGVCARFAQGAVQPPTSSTLTTISKATLKAVCSGGGAFKKDAARTFILRNIDCSKVTTCDDLKDIIKNQLRDDISREFDVGYIQGTNVIRVRSEADLAEMWPDLKSGKVSVWCDGLKHQSKTKGKRKLYYGDSDEEEDIYTSKKKRQPTGLHQCNCVFGVR